VQKPPWRGLLAAFALEEFDASKIAAADDATKEETLQLRRELRPMRLVATGQREPLDEGPPSVQGNVSAGCRSAKAPVKWISGSR